MKFAPILAWLLAGASFIHAEDKQAILARMDEAAPKFRSMSAMIQMVTFTAIISDKTVENGSLKMQRLPGGEVRALLDFSGAHTDARQIGFFGRMIQIYYPKLKTYQEYDVGKNTDVLNQFLLLGFGSSGKDLSNSYDISDEGMEKVAGADTTKLLLLPKDEGVKKRLSKIEMWIPAGATYPVQQQFYEASGNYRVVTYSNVRLGSAVKGKLELKLPSDAKRQGS